jgi:O-antigen/teichoic acid export membrane protein
MVSFLGLLDLGMRGAVTRFVARDHAQGRHSEASQAVSAALWLRLWMSVGIVIISLGLAAVVPSVFAIPQELNSAARWAIVLSSIGAAVSLTFGVFGGVLSALYRFDLISVVVIGQTLFRAAGTVWLLSSGYGIAVLAMWELLVIVVGSATLGGVAFRLYRELRVVFTRPDPATFRSLWNYSIYAFLINVSIQIVYYTSNLVVGAFISATAVTFYAIGGGLILYLRQLVASLTVTFTPLASRFEAQEQTDHLRRLLIHGTRAALFVALPIEVALFVRGPTFIGLWMGPEYAQASGEILRILLLAQLVAIANYTSGGIAYGLGKHRIPAMWAMAEAGVNLIASLVFVRWFGAVGVAWATVVATWVTNLPFWPRYVSMLVGVPVRQYLWQSWIRPTIAVVPFGLACYLAERLWVADTVWTFFLQMAGLLPVFFAGILLCFWRETTGTVRRYLAGAPLTEPAQPASRDLR